MIMQDIDNLKMMYELPDIFSYKYPEKYPAPIFIFPIRYVSVGAVYFPCIYKKCPMLIKNVGDSFDT